MGQTRLILTFLRIAACLATAAFFLTGCGGNPASQGVPPPTPEQLRAMNANNPHMPPQARAAAQMRLPTPASPGVAAPSGKP